MKKFKIAVFCVAVVADLCLFLLAYFTSDDNSMSKNFSFVAFLVVVALTGFAHYEVVTHGKED